MDFFAHQDNARRLSRRLTFLFALAVIAIVVAVNLVVAVAFGPFHSKWSPVVVTLATLALILGGSLFRVFSLSEGGPAVAAMVGARRVLPSTVELDERRLLNIVEEMALASGIAVPLVFVMDRESTINAFAAGYSPNEAIVCVTRGTLKQLSRDELQGVIAHEFSHILNGDMRLNIRMIGLLFGILLIGLIGRMLMEGTRGSSSSRDRDTNTFFFVGLALFALGYIGVFFANVIKAAVSRQREYLADASAVQFTRNPEGIGGALVKIGRFGGVVGAARADELSHMFLGAGTRQSIDGWLATHPPLDERVARILGPERAKVLGSAAADVPGSRGERDVAPMGASGFAVGEARNPTPAAGEWGRRNASRIEARADAVLGTVGNPSEAHVEYARSLLDHLPGAVRTAIGNEAGARAAVVAMLLDAEPIRAQQLERTEAAAGSAVAHMARDFVEPLHALGPRARLPVIDLAIPTLKALPSEERRDFLALVRTLALVDARVSPFEFVVTAILERQLDDDVGRRQVPRYASLGAVADQVATVVSVFVRAASGGSVLFDRVMAPLAIGGGRLTAPSALDFGRVRDALVTLQALAPLEKPRVIKACLEAVLDDGKIAVVEAELMRAVCAMLDSPLPPIIDRSLRQAVSQQAA